MTDQPKSLSIACQVDHAIWDSLPNADALAEAAIGAALKVLPRGRFQPTQEAELSIFFTNNTVSRDLNRSHRGKDQPTNVLSFAQPSPISPIPWPIGDIVLAAETISDEANLAQLSLSDHTSHLIVHGFLHILGYDHQRDEDATEMEALETGALAELGIKDPYGFTNGQVSP